MFTREKPNDLKISCTCSSFLLLGFRNELIFDSFQHFVLHVNDIHRSWHYYLYGSNYTTIFFFGENIFYGFVYYNTQQKNMENRLAFNKLLYTITHKEQLTLSLLYLTPVILFYPSMKDTFIKNKVKNFSIVLILNLFLI